MSQQKTMKCCFCGKTENLTTWSPREELLKTRHCCDCHFWLDRFDRKRAIICKGVAYSLGPEDPDIIMRGYGGRGFVAKMLDGKFIHSSNLWHVGEIPQIYREELPDNAEYLVSEPSEREKFIAEILAERDKGNI